MYRFNKNAVVCFLGDSITARAKWVCRIMDYYRENVPGSTLKAITCGRPGGNATVAIKRMVSDLYPYNPTDVVIMFGMNDICRQLYICEKVTEEILNDRTKVLKEYEVALRTIGEELTKRGAKLIFCTPTPTDVNQINGTPYLPGTLVGLKKTSEIVKKVAADFGGHVVDFYQEFGDMIELLREENPYNNIVSVDTVHPNETGEEVMANIFLKAQGFDLPLYDKMADWEKQRAKPFSAYVKRFFEIAGIQGKIAFVQWSILRNVPEDKFKETIAEEYKDTAPGEFRYGCLEGYEKHISKKEEYMQELINM